MIPKKGTVQKQARQEPFGAFLPPSEGFVKDVFTKNSPLHRDAAGRFRFGNQPFRTAMNRLSIRRQVSSGRTAKLVALASISSVG